MKIFTLLLTFCLISTYVLAQSNEEAAVKAPIQQFFDGMRQSDSTMIKKTILKGAYLERIVTDANGTRISSTPFDGFIKGVASRPKGDLDEQLTSVELRIDDNMATAWTPYKFYLKGKFSHCGVNTFRLVKTADGWKIWSVMDTNRKDNCK